MDQSTHRASPSLTRRSAMLPFCSGRRGGLLAGLLKRCKDGNVVGSPGAAPSPLHSARTHPPNGL